MPPLAESLSATATATPAPVAATHQAPPALESLSIPAACAFIHEREGHRPNPATVFRWMQQGRLPYRRVGRRRFTTRTAVLQLLEAFNARPTAAAAEPPAPRQDVQQAGAEAAERIARMGA